MGDGRLLRRAQPVEAFGTPALAALIEDMRDTMRHLTGAGLAAPQIGVDLRVVIFGGGPSPRYPDASVVPDTVLINPVLTPLVEAQIPDQMKAHKMDRETVIRIERLLNIAEYKRRQAPPGVKLGTRNFGRDRRYPITHAFRTA